MKPKIRNFVAKHAHLAGKAGCHEAKKYTRKKKHKKIVDLIQE
jgi:hypothetical protein